ncbi:MAG: PGF-pre-PGF domain-containing protein [Methanosarcinaceae archaeon]|nr:PGF-pre-PGF domain-containing protein [Methanosarcinaceae archaeon]
MKIIKIGGIISIFGSVFVCTATMMLILVMMAGTTSAAPSFNTTNNTPTGNINYNTLWINATFIDATTGVNVSATTVTVNGIDVTGSLDVNTSTKIAYNSTTIAEGIIPVNISITDYMGNTTWNNWTFVVDTTPPAQITGLKAIDTPSDSGGRSSVEPYENVALKDVVSVYVSVDNTIKYAFKDDESPIDFVFFDAKKNSGYIAATVEVLKNRSSLVSSNPKGQVYKYMNILVGKDGFATDANIANPVIEFKIAKSWISENGIDESTIKLNRYNLNKWSSLPTTKISENNSYIYFRSESPGFSPFAITGDKKSTVVVKESAPIIEKVEAPIVETVEETVVEPQEEDEPKYSNLTIVLVIVLIGITIIVFLIILKRKHNTLKREQRLLKERQNGMNK